MTDTVNCSCLINSRGVVLVWCRSHFEALKKEQLAEREACAKIAEAEGVRQYEIYSERDPEVCADEIAKAIRNRT